jgi:hypothetical protein|tara:strand:- start:2269 stop:2394 length:126 start_codon:yes stop_codon:yes gene_type:complete
MLLKRLRPVIDNITKRDIAFIKNSVNLTVVEQVVFKKKPHL